MWKRMPHTYGPYWFCTDLKDRDLSELKRVSRIEQGGSPPFFILSHDFEYKAITPADGWWLLIHDERKTAPVEAQP